MLKQKAVLLGYNSPEYIEDCGTPTRLDKVCADLISGRVAQPNQQSAGWVERSHHQTDTKLPVIRTGFAMSL
jgi:hypothetical protein